MVRFILFLIATGCIATIIWAILTVLKQLKSKPVVKDDYTVLEDLVSELKEKIVKAQTTAEAGVSSAQKQLEDLKKQLAKAEELKNKFQNL
jgi:predicted nuclease with TOPRIM domain